MSAPAGEQQQTGTPASAPAGGVVPTPGTGAGQQQPEKQFSQSEVERMVEERLIRERKKYSDYDDLKTKAGKWDQAEAANATDMEKAVKKAVDEAVTGVRQSTDQKLITAEVRALAAAAKFHDPAVAATLADVSGIKVAEDGTVDSAAAEAAVKAVAAKYPYMLAADDGKNTKTPRRDPGQGPRAGEKPDGRDAGRAEAERRFGAKK